MTDDRARHDQPTPGPPADQRRAVGSDGEEAGAVAEHGDVEADLDALVQIVHDEVERARAEQDPSRAWWRDPDLDPTDPDALTVGNSKSLKGKAKDVAKRGVGLQLRAARRQAGRYGLATQQSVDQLEVQLADLQTSAARNDWLWSVLAGASPALDASTWVSILEAHTPSAKPTLIAASRFDQFEDAGDVTSARLGSWYLQAPSGAQVGGAALHTPGRRGALRTHLRHIRRGELSGAILVGVLDAIPGADRLEILALTRLAVPQSAPLTVVSWTQAAWVASAGVLAEDLMSQRPWRPDTWRAVCSDAGWHPTAVDHASGFNVLRFAAS